MKTKPRIYAQLSERFWAWVEVKENERSRSFSSYSYRAAEPESRWQDVEDTLAAAFYGNSQRPCAPKREHVATKKVTTKTTSFPAGGDASITFKGREVIWSVGENNHAVENARQHPLAIAFFKALNTVNWTRGTGGVIEYDDEYRRENWAGATVSSRFGPRGVADLSPKLRKEYLDAQIRARRPLTTGYGRGRW